MRLFKEARFRLGSARHAHHLHGQLAKYERQLAEYERQLAEYERQLAECERQAEYYRSGVHPEGVRPENITWIFGTARVGSTWLAQMMTMLPGFVMWREPFIGKLFGQILYETARTWQPESEQFVLGKPREKWLPHVRRMVMDGVNAATKQDPYGHVVVKEPNGSIGAPILVEAVPESRMVAILRDPRDVVASAIDAASGWGRKDAPNVIEEPRESIVMRVSNKYVSYVGNSLKAYEQHAGLKAIVRYEELRFRTLDTMRSLIHTLRLEVEDAPLRRAVERTAWENIPVEKKGTGKFRRKAEPGGWREDLAGDEVAEIEKKAGAMMDELGYERAT